MEKLLYAKNARHQARGFTLIELAIVLMLFGVLVGGGLLGVARVSQKLKIDATQEKIDLAFNALSSYAQRYKRLPCPADPNGNGRERLNGNCFATASAGALYADMQGVLPWRELGIPEALVRDGWGRYITYKPAPQLTVNYLSPEMQENTSADANKTDVHDACRSPLWYTSRRTGNKVTYTHTDRQKALFCCNTAPRTGYLGTPLPASWRDQAIIAAGALPDSISKNLDAGSALPANIPVESTNAWMDGVDANGNIMPVDGQQIGGIFADPDYGVTVNDSPDTPLSRATGQAVTLISHGGNGLLSYLRGQNGNIRLQANFDSGSGITSGGDIAANEKLNVWPPQIAAATTYHPKVSDGLYDPLGMRSGASDDRAAFLQTDQLFSRIGSTSCLQHANSEAFEYFCKPDTYDDVIYLLDTSNSMQCRIFANESGCYANRNKIPKHLKRINVAKEALEDIMAAHIRTEYRDDKDFDQVGYSGFHYKNPQYTDDSLFFKPAFAAEEAQALAGDPKPLQDALAKYGKNDGDIDGSGTVDNNDLIEARIEIATNQMSKKMDAISTTNGTPLIKSVKTMNNLLLEQAGIKMCNQLLANNVTSGLPSVCNGQVAIYNQMNDPDAFVAKFKPEPLEDKDSNGQYDLEPNAIIMLSDGNDTEEKIGGKNTNQWIQAGHPEKARQIYQRAGNQLIAAQQTFNQQFAQFGFEEKQVNLFIVDVVDNPGLSEFARITGGQRVKVKSSEELKQELQFLAGLGCSGS